MSLLISALVNHHDWHLTDRDGLQNLLLSSSSILLWLARGLPQRGLSRDLSERASTLIVRDADDDLLILGILLYSLGVLVAGA